MEIKEILAAKDIKAKQKTDLISSALLSQTLSVDDLIQFAQTAKAPQKATCIEAIEYATKQTPTIINANGFSFAIENLAHKAPRVKWESAKVIGNTAHLFHNKLDTAIKNLLDNTTHTGTVVRWSAAFALGEILKLRLPLNNDLIAAVDAIIEKEEKNSIRKIYLDALKKLKK